MKRIPTAPRRLIDGDTIGVVAPASPFDPDRFRCGLDVLTSMGFQTVYDDSIFKKGGYLAGTDAHRSRQLQRYFGDERIKGIICARGGYGSIRVLSRLRSDAIRDTAKCFIGFSDITAIHSVLYTKCGLVTFHGPTVTALATATKRSREAFVEAVSSRTPLQIKPVKGVTLRSGTASGRIVGGNLTTLCHLTGTPYQPDFDGHILILEDTSESEYRIDRMLTHMKLAGLFKTVAGVCLGSFRGCGKIEEIHRIAKETFREYNIPILGGMPVGHDRTNITIPLGVMVTLDAVKKVVSYHEPATT